MQFVEPIRDKTKIEAMKRHLKGGNIRDYALFTLGINSGLRISDLLSLRTADVLNEKGKVRDRLELREIKTGKVKDFPLGAKAKKALEEYLNRCSPGEWLFPSRIGQNPIGRRHAWTLLSRAAKAVGIAQRIGSHSLRKTFGYWAFQEGYDITRIQKLLNHSSPAITLAYIGITKDELDEVYLSLDL